MITVPATLEMIGEAAFKGCSGLESCSIVQDGNLVRIEREAFSDCCSLRSFDVPVSVELIGDDCFKKCVSLYRLRFASVEVSKKFVSDLRVDESLERIGLDEIRTDLRVEFYDGGVNYELAGWSPVSD
jgi:hypothetical protein